jgi:hypothetical protein
MATQPQETRRYVVIAATRKDRGGGATVGYFKTLAEVPPEFKYPGEEDITHVMESMRLTDLDRCLAIMNCHWQTPPFHVPVIRR